MKISSTELSIDRNNGYMVANIGKEIQCIKHNVDAQTPNLSLMVT